MLFRSTGLIDAELIEARITPRTKAIMPVSLYGQVPDMDRINEIAARHGNIPVIEDAAQSFGATYHGRRSCGVSTIGCTSFFPSKPLGCYGDGGAIFTNNDAIAEASRAIRVHGQKKRYVHEMIGVGGRMDTLQCAIVLAKWPRFAWEVESRQEIGRRYSKLLAAAAIPSIKPVEVRASRTSVFAQYTVIAEDREAVRAALQAADIPTAVHYPVPVNSQPGYRAVRGTAGTPIAERLAQQVLSLPMGPDLGGLDQDKVMATLVAGSSVNANAKSVIVRKAA